MQVQMQLQMQLQMQMQVQIFSMFMSSAGGCALGDRGQTQVQDGTSVQSPSNSGYKYKSHPASNTLKLQNASPVYLSYWHLLINLLVQVELKVMELLGGAEALPEDILRILK